MEERYLSTSEFARVFVFQELVEDFVEIVTSFTSRIYGKRSSKYEEVVKCIGEVVKDSD